MEETVIHLIRDNDGGVAVEATHDGQRWQHGVKKAAFTQAQRDASRLMEGFESGTRPLADPVALAQLGVQLRDTFLAPFYAQLSGQVTQAERRLLFASSSGDCLNLPWELLPGPNGHFLVADGRWAIRRATRPNVPPPGAPPAARPLRILFTACAPTNLKGLDFEKEEEAILRIADRLGGKVHLDIAEAGTFASATSTSKTSAAASTPAGATKWPSVSSLAAACAWCS